MKRAGCLERPPSLPEQVRELVYVCCCQGLRQSQAKTLAVLVAGALSLTRATLIGLAICLQRQGLAATVKHALKRVWRYVDNDRIDVNEALGPLWKKLLKKRKKKLLVAVDWTDIKGFKVLVAAACLKGRAMWLCWKSVPTSGLNLNMSRMEQDLLWALQQLLPPGLKVIILADRGFFKSRLFKYCQQRHLDYVIRIKPDWNVRARRFKGNLLDLPVKPGTARFWTHALCGIKPVVDQNLVIYYQRGLPEKRDEPWFLATSLTGRPEQIVKLYAKRMRVEECFRDTKSLRNGLALRHTQIKLAERLDRWLLVLMLAYLVLCGLGLYALRKWHPRCWSSSSRPGQCSIYTIGARVLSQLQVPLEQVLAALQQSLWELSPKWG